jgi:predicted nucleotidyltransferase
MKSFKDRVLEALVAPLKESSQTVALWECGSASNGTSDPYSDIDIRIVAQDSIEHTFDLVEATLSSVFAISHRFVEPKCFLPGYYQRIYFLEGAPKHFFVDVAVFLQSSEDLLLEFLEIERHGSPVIHFDKSGQVKPRNGDPAALKTKQRKRFEEIEVAYPAYKTEVMKELDRGNAIDAFAFYFLGMVRPLAELMGIIHRPFKYDFGLRYIHKMFPDTDRKAIESLSYVKDIDELKERAILADRLIQETMLRVRETLDQ